MGNEREHDPSVDGETGRSPGSGRAKEYGSQGQIKSAEWTSSTYRSARRFTDVPGTPKTPRRRPPDTDARDAEPVDEKQ